VSAQRLFDLSDQILLHVTGMYVYLFKCVTFIYLRLRLHFLVLLALASGAGGEPGTVIYNIFCLVRLRAIWVTNHPRSLL